MTNAPHLKTNSYAGQLGPKFRAVLPKAVRDVLHVSEGDTLLYLVEGDQVRLTTKKQLVDELCGVFATDDGRDYTAELLQERQAEANAAKPNEQPKI